MELQLTKPIIFFDLETTGVSIATDRVVEISILKIHPNGNKESKTWLVNPEMEIPASSTEIHKITNEKVANEPTFKELAPEIDKMIAGCDLAGFNSNRFDIPLLAEELMRAGLDFDMKDRKAVDVQVIFHKKEQRTLSAGYQFYCGKELEGAHGAEAATYEILKAQLDKYDDIENSIDALSEFSSHTKRADFAGFILFNEDYKGRTVEEVLKENPGYNSWIQNADFPLYTKKVLRQIKERMSAPKKKMTDAEKLQALQQKFNLR